MCVYVCVLCVGGGVGGCIPLSMCVCRCVYVCVCVVVGGVDRCIPLTILVDACQCCCLLMFVRLPLFKTLSLLLNLVNKESE